MLAECRIQNPHRTLSELQVRENTRRAEYRGGGQNHKRVNERGQNTEYMIEESNCIVVLSITRHTRSTFCGRENYCRDC